jgi:hypothetical protein
LGPADGIKLTTGGVYREIVRQQRVVNTQTFEFECNSQEGEQVEVSMERQSRTTPTCTIVDLSKEARDRTIASGMAKACPRVSTKAAAVPPKQRNLKATFESEPASLQPPPGQRNSAGHLPAGIDRL